MAAAVLDNPQRSRYELRVDGELVGWSEYRPAADSLIVAHTEIVPGRESEGLASLLVGETLKDIGAKGKTVIPTCPFTAAYIRRHTEFADLVDPSLRDQFKAT